MIRRCVSFHLRYLACVFYFVAYHYYIRYSHRPSIRSFVRSSRHPSTIPTFHAPTHPLSPSPLSLFLGSIVLCTISFGHHVTCTAPFIGRISQQASAELACKTSYPYFSLCLHPRPPFMIMPMSLVMQSSNAPRPIAIRIRRIVYVLRNFII